MKTINDFSSRFTQRRIAKEIGVGATAVNNAVSRGLFPAAWFDALEQLCQREGEDCPRALFNFKSPSEPCDGAQQ